MESSSALKDKEERQNVEYEEKYKETRELLKDINMSLGMHGRGVERIEEIRKKLDERVKLKEEMNVERRCVKLESPEELEEKIRQNCMKLELGENLEKEILNMRKKIKNLSENNEIMMRKSIKSIRNQVPKTRKEIYNCLKEAASYVTIAKDGMRRDNVPVPIEDAEAILRISRSTVILVKELEKEYCDK
jgi:ElaB/YqjD/DUF883 family membrane-anchored ribosome-binding protein